MKGFSDGCTGSNLACNSFYCLQCEEKKEETLMQKNKLFDACIFNSLKNKVSHYTTIPPDYKLKN